MNEALDPYQRYLWLYSDSHCTVHVQSDPKNFLYKLNASLSLILIPLFFLKLHANVADAFVISMTQTDGGGGLIYLIRERGRLYSYALLAVAEPVAPGEPKRYVSYIC